jgi:hypothetical protein
MAGLEVDSVNPAAAEFSGMTTNTTAFTITHHTFDIHFC